MNVYGMNRDQGLTLTGIAHIQQSIKDILTTPIGSRIMRREYGSHLPDLIDQPLHGATLMKAYAATATALLRWEPRIRLSRLQLVQSDISGQVILELAGTLINSNKPLSLHVAITMGAIT